MNAPPGSVHVFWSTRDWAEAIASMPVEGPLPCRTVLVPRERVAHALRRELLRAGHPEALAGTRFLTTAEAAIAVLHAAGMTFTPGEEAFRPARLLALFRRGLRLEHFPLDLLRSKPGWDETFARTIGDLEGAGLRPEDLERAGMVAQLRDVAAIWRAADQAAGTSWTTQRICLEAARALEQRPTLWPFPGALLAAAGSDVTAAEAQFLRAMPGVTLGFLAARPVRERYLDRIAALFGSRAAEALRSTTAPRASATERDLLASYLFEPPAILGDPGRPRSAGPDGTVSLEEHAGLEEEIEATADWVARQVLDGIPLEEIAVLLPALDPLAGLVAERLARLPWENGALPVHVAGGLPLTCAAAAARALAVVRALRAYLAGDALTQVLPALRTAGNEGRPPSHGAASDLVWSLGTAGGNAAHPEGALEWATRAARRERELEVQLQNARDAGDDPERPGLARQARDLERLLTDLRAVRPALDRLVGVARFVVDEAPLATLWPALRDFLKDWLLQPGEGPRVLALLDSRLRGIAEDPVSGALAGDDALRVIEAAIATARLQVGRFGDPAVYIGTVRDAAGLDFRAVRVIGLAEGHLPPLTREDPVLPDHLRGRLTACGAGGRTISPPTAADRALEALHALDQVIRNAGSRVALSAPRLDLERSQREPSSVILEAAAALGRPNASTGAPALPIPDTVALRRDAFLPARRAALQFRCTTPVGETAWQDGVALGALGIPRGWRGVQAIDLRRVAVLREAGEAGPLDGLLGEAARTIAVPGLTRERPISPSALQTLLQCPYLFLLGNLLGFEEPTAAPPLREIGQPAYGELFHRVAEAFYRAHGTRFCAREGTLAAWLDRADAIVDRIFEAFLEQYPLVGEGVRRIQRERLRRDLHDLLEHDWSRGAATRFVAAERAFGWPEAVELQLGGRSLFVRGQIDCIEVDGERTLVRDLKTGRPHPRLGQAAGPDPGLDLQLAVYGLVATRLADEWAIPRKVGAAYTYVGQGADERAWREDFHGLLEPAAREWLATAADLLAKRSFPRTPIEADCTWCCFRAVCGDGAWERAARVLAGGAGALSRFKALKGVEPAAKE